MSEVAIGRKEKHIIRRRSKERTLPHNSNCVTSQNGMNTFI